MSAIGVSFVRRVVVATLVLVMAPAVASAQKLVIAVRHAERADGGAGAGMAGAPADPPLSAEGAARAERLAAMLSSAGIAAIYATEFKRTQDTAKPIASKLGLVVTTIAARDTDALVAELRRAHSTDVVLVVGHSNTIPAVIKAYGGPDVTISDNDYGAIFVLVPATGALTTIRY
jgi:broad specificity phosphatase PhoE